MKQRLIYIKFIIYLYILYLNKKKININRNITLIYFNKNKYIIIYIILYKLI